MSRRREIQDGLAGVALFQACSKRDLGIVARHTEVAEISAGTKITEEGGKGDAFFFILGGEASVRRGGRTVNRLGPGSHFGELALIDPAPRDATVVADTSLTVGVIGARVFRAMLRDVPSMNERLMKGLARRLREADSRDA
jgi:CRP-like cAMP-binding protein